MDFFCSAVSAFRLIFDYDLSYTPLPYLSMGKLETDENSYPDQCKFGENLVSRNAQTAFIYAPCAPCLS